MLGLPVLIVDWVYECCGKAVSVGQRVELQLTFDGDLVPTDDPEGVEVVEDGGVRLVADPVGSLGEDDGYHTKGTRLVAGPVTFGVVGEVTTRVCCSGELSELRHGYPDGLTAGTVLSVRRCAAMYEKRAERVWEVVGYEPGEEVGSTDARRPPGTVGPVVPAGPTGAGRGWFARAPLADDEGAAQDSPPDGWAYRVVLGVDEV